MSDTRFEEVEDLFHQALQLSPEKQSSFLDEACMGRPKLRSQVEAVLRADGGKQGFLSRPATVESAPLEEAFRVTKIGRYTTQRVIGSGGMGTVFEATQEDPQRSVALKVMHPGIVSPIALRRFHHEVQVLAHLRHPRIAQLYESGLHEENGVEVPFFAMEYIPEASDLLEHATNRRLSVEDKLRLFVKVCDAVHHGHQKGIIHRDLKPANILVDETGEPKVIDFGVARSTDSDLTTTTLQTQAGQLVGTIQYMSPEQCDADPHNIDIRSDVYSLGVLLYQLLTGQLPYDAETRTIYQATKAIKEAKPRPLSAIDRSLKGDVERVCLKALEKERDRRYQSAVEFARDIEHVVNKEPIQARRSSIAYHLWKFATRNPWGAGAMFAVFIAIGTVFGAVMWMLDVESVGRLNAQKMTYVASLAAMRSSLAAGDYATARRAHDVVLKEVPPHIWSWELDHVGLLMEPSLAVVRQSDALHHLELVPGRGDLAVVRGNTVRILDLKTGEQLWGFQSGEFAVSADGTQLAVGQRGRLEVWDISQPDRPLLSTVLGSEYGPTSALAFHPNGRSLAGAEGHIIALWDLTTRKEHHLKGYSDVDGLQFSPDGRYLASASHDSAARLWRVDEENLAGTHPVAVLEGHTNKVAVVAFSPDGKLLATGSLDHTVRLWDLERAIEAYSRSDKTGSIVRASLQTLEAEDQVLSVDFSPDGNRLAAGCLDRRIRVWERNKANVGAQEPAAPFEQVMTLEGHEGWVTDVRYTEDSRRLISSSMEGEVRVWHGEPIESVPTLYGPYHHWSSVNGVVYLPDRDRIAVAGGDCAVRIWSMRTASGQQSLYGHGHAVRGIAYSTALDLLATGDSDGRLILWRAGDAEIEPLLDLEESDSPIEALAFDASGALLAVATQDALILLDLRNVPQVEETLCFPLPARANSVAFLRNHYVVVGCGVPEGREGSRNHAVYIVNLQDGNVVFKYELPAAARAVACSEDGSFLAVTCDDEKVYLWQTEDPRNPRLRPVLQSTALMRSVCFHPGGTRLVAGCDDGTIKIWDVDRGFLVSSWNAHKGEVNFVGFNADGTTLASTSSGHQGEDTSIKLWESKVPNETRVARANFRAAIRRARHLLKRGQLQSEVERSINASSLDPEAKSAALQLARFEGDSPMALLNRSRKFIRAGRFEEAIRFALQAEKARPGHHEYLHHLGVAQYAAGDYTSSAQTLEAAHNAPPGGHEDAMTVAYLVLVHQRLGNESAMEEWSDKLHDYQDLERWATDEDFQALLQQIQGRKATPPR